MAAPSAQACHALTTYYIGKYRDIHEKEPLVNRNKARAGASGLLMDHTPAQARELVDFYIEHWADPKIQWFFYNYELVEAALIEHNENEISRARRRQQTQERLEQWRNRWKSTQQK
jgi:hypothetical protein